MIALLLRYMPDLADMLRISNSHDKILINVNLIESIEEIKLAEFLAKKSFAEGTNIGKKFKYEFLLWLTGKRDIKNALLLSKPDKDNAILILFKNSGNKKILKKLGTRKLNIRKKSDVLRLEKISLGRIKD